MFCSFNTNDNKGIYIAFIKALSAKMEAIKNNPDAQFNLVDIMKEVFDRTMARTSDYEQAVNNARMVPGIIYEITGRDKELSVPLIPKGLDPTQVYMMSAAVEREDTGVEQTEKTLGVV